MMHRTHGASFKVVFSPSKKNCFICFNENPLKVMKNAFYFILWRLILIVFNLAYDKNKLYKTLD